MSMTSLGIEDAPEPDRRHARDRRSDEDGWRPTLMHGMWAFIVAVLGYLVTDYNSTRTKLIDQVNSDTQRISVLEESNRNTREALQRIESGVYELRQQQQERRR